MHDVIKSCMSKKLYKVQDRPMGFNITEYQKVIDIVIDSTLQANVRTLPLLSVISKTIHNVLKRLLKYLSLYNQIV